MRDYIYIGSAPADEPCVQVDPNVDYLPAMRAECARYRDLIRQALGPEPEGARLSIRAEDHDFGTYLVVVCAFDDDLPESVEYAYRAESDAPATWNIA